MLILVVIVAALVAVLVGVNLGWQWVLAPLLGFAVLKWSIASLRILVTDAKGHDEPDSGAPVSDDERTMYWCEECGTEVLLVFRGTSRPPSHCGQRMHERTELLNEN